MEEQSGPKIADLFDDEGDDGMEEEEEGEQVKEIVRAFRPGVDEMDEDDVRTPLAY